MVVTTGDLLPPPPMGDLMVCDLVFMLMLLHTYMLSVVCSIRILVSLLDSISYLWVLFLFLHSAFCKKK